MSATKCLQPESGFLLAELDHLNVSFQAPMVQRTKWQPCLLGIVDQEVLRSEVTLTFV